MKNQMIESADVMNITGNKSKTTTKRKRSAARAGSTFTSMSNYLTSSVAMMAKNDSIKSGVQYAVGGGDLPVTLNQPDSSHKSDKISNFETNITRNTRNHEIERQAFVDTKLSEIDGIKDHRERG